MIDMSKMCAVVVDSKKKTAWAEGGCLLGDVDAETGLHGYV
jgi:FAD/FMN-containing dehydrogenase